MTTANQETVYEGWLTKSPPTKRIWRAVSFVEGNDSQIFYYAAISKYNNVLSFVYNNHLNKIVIIS